MGLAPREACISLQFTIKWHSFLLIDLLTLIWIENYLQICCFFRIAPFVDKHFNWIVVASLGMFGIADSSLSIHPKATSQVHLQHSFMNELAQEMRWYGRQKCCPVSNTMPLGGVGTVRAYMSWPSHHLKLQLSSDGHTCWKRGVLCGWFCLCQGCK